MFNALLLESLILGVIELGVRELGVRELGIIDFWTAKIPASSILNMIPCGLLGSLKILTGMVLSFILIVPVIPDCKLGVPLTEPLIENHSC